MGFTHVQFMPVMEHPFHGSWGYHITGYFAPSSRYGTPQDFMYLVDCLHQADIGVILDWVPGHFPDDPHALARFDGTCLYEHEDDRRGLHPEWKSRIFNYSRHEVRSFLISSALFWLDKYHIDGLRVDAVSSMLYLDYAREPGEWIPNHLGGRENLEAVDFLRGLNRVVHENYPDARMIAEESSNWPLVSHPEIMGGLGFDMKWDMGWMNDTLDYFQLDPVHRRHHQNQITFRSLYGHQEHFVLPLSHDEVVHGHGSLMGKMPGDDWQKFANLRALYSYMYALPGKKHLFMGCEIAQRDEWDHDSSIQWHLEDYPPHAGMKALLSDLNRLYRSEPAMHNDFGPEGFAWIDGDDHENSVLCFLRRDKAQRTEILCLLNFTPVPRHAYEVGVPRSGSWREILNSDSRIYGGCDCGNGGILHSVAEPRHDHDHKIRVTLPPLGALFLKWMD
jgi:1,4-alpha-glucan branching enzyme